MEKYAHEQKLQRQNGANRALNAISLANLKVPRKLSFKDKMKKTLQQNEKRLKQSQEEEDLDNVMLNNIQ